MDGARFDVWTRRHVSLATGALLAGLGGFVPPLGEAKKKKKKCKKPKVKCKKKCCKAGQVCKSGKCATPPPAGECQFTKTATLWTLQGNCTITKTIEIPDGVTLDGNGKTITMTGNVSGYSAPVAQGNPAGLLAKDGSATVRNLSIDGTGLVDDFTQKCFLALAFHNTSGAIEDVLIANIRPEITFPCGIGLSLEGESDHSVTLTNVEATDIASSALAVAGVTVEITGADLRAAQVSVSFGDASGTISQSTIHSGITAVGSDLTIQNNTFKVGADGIFIGPLSSATIENNTFEGIHPDANAAVVALNGGDYVIKDNTVTGINSGFQFFSSPDIDPAGGNEPISAEVTGNTISGTGVAPDPFTAGVNFSRLATGSVSGNTIANFKNDDPEQTSCGIRIEADAGVVTIGTNTFPNPPGNEQDVCDFS